MNVPGEYANKLKYSDLEHLSTEELEEILQDDFYSCEEQMPDVSYIMMIVEILQKRGHEKEDDTIFNAEVAWKDFIKDYKDQASLADFEINLEERTNFALRTFQNFSQKKKLNNRRVSGLIAAATLFGVVFITVVSGFDLSEIWRKSSEERYHTISSEGAIRSEDDKLEEQLELLKTEISEYTPLPVLPQWFPDGTSIQNIQTTSQTGSTEITGDFVSNENQLFLSIVIYDFVPKDSSPTKGSAEESLAVEYDVDGIKHYIIRNDSILKAVWYNENLECSIQGILSMEEMKQMLDSIYE